MDDIVVSHVFCLMTTYEVDCSVELPCWTPWGIGSRNRQGTHNACSKSVEQMELGWIWQKWNLDEFEYNYINYITLHVVSKPSSCVVVSVVSHWFPRRKWYSKQQISPIQAFCQGQRGCHGCHASGPGMAGCCWTSPLLSGAMVIQSGVRNHRNWYKLVMFSTTAICWTQILVSNRMTLYCIWDVVFHTTIFCWKNDITW